ncbi:MAG: hypothetical protein WAX67_08385 [Rugosibacter sp.]
MRGEVLRLSYTAHDLAPFALFFHLYNINRDDAAYILDSFPSVREQDEKAHGRYLTKALIMAYMNAVAAGDFTTVVHVEPVAEHESA